MNTIKDQASALITRLDSLDTEVGLSLREYYAPWGLLNTVLHDNQRTDADRERYLRLAEEFITLTEREHKR